MPIEITYNSIDEVPAEYKDLYSEQDGKAVLTGVVGLKTQKDIDTLSEALRKERKDHKEAKDKLAPWNGLDHSEVLTKLDKYDELEILATGKIDDTKINQLVETKLNQIKGPLERDLKKFKEMSETLLNENTSLKHNENLRLKNDQIRSAAIEAKVIPEAIDDILIIAGSLMELNEDGKAITKQNGLDPKTFFIEMQQKRPHWWPASAGGGGQGSGGQGGFATNPWTKDNFNMTEQGKIFKTNPVLAEQMKKAAGVK